jgi:CubicO group peptidase (beta-lactamase class C family)
LGIEYDLGNLNLNATLEELGVDDIEGLTGSEKKATIYHLITSSSGVYHPGAYESNEQEGARPPRGSFKPGEFFYYNNWDFNAIGHIYSKISNKDLFVAIENSISDKIGMEDFQLEHTKYEFQKSKSKFPAYRMQTSARDDARLGYLYLRNGKWKDKQLLSEEWISKSFEKHADTGEYRYYDYGLLWWIDITNKLYIARGNSGQYIAIYPEEDMVFVFRADPGSVLRKWMGLRVKPQESFPFINKILSARID